MKREGNLKCIRSEVVMGTVVTIGVIHPDAQADAAFDRAFGWFQAIEAIGVYVSSRHWAVSTRDRRLQ